VTIKTGKLALTVWIVLARVRGYMVSC